MFQSPDFTRAQVVALASAVIGVAVAFGVNITDAQSTALIGLVTIVSSVLIAGDAVIRHGRATGNASKE